MAIGSACLLAACSSHGSSETAPTADISKISQVKSDFGPAYKVKDTPKTSIDPKVLATHKLPPGLTFDPPDCSSFVVGQDMPPGLQGNMAAVAAEGAGNRFIAMAFRLTSYLEIRVRAPQYRELTAAYCIADDRAMVYRLRADRYEGIAGFNNPPMARQYLQEFDGVWQASAPEEPEVRIARR